MLHLVWSRERNDKTLTPTPTGVVLMTVSDWKFCATNNIEVGKELEFKLTWNFFAAKRNRSMLIVNECVRIIEVSLY